MRKQKDKGWDICSANLAQNVFVDVHGVRYTPTRKAPIHRDWKVLIDALEN